MIRGAAFPRILAAVPAFLIAALSIAEAASDWMIDFERDRGLWGIPSEPDLGGARVRVVEAGADGLGGSQALSADSMGLDTYWHEFLHTTSRVDLRPGTSYEIRMDARILEIDPGARKDRPAFYFMLRSRSLGPSDEGDVYGPFWLREKGAETEIGGVLRTPEGVDDCYLNLGIRKNGALLVDNIRIREVGVEPSPAAGMRLEPLPPDSPEPWRFLGAHREKHELARTLEDMTVVAIFESCNGTMNEVSAFMDEHVRPDAIDWASSRVPGQVRVAQNHASWFTTSALEYQECYKVEAPDIWDDRWKLLLDGGMVRTLAGQINSWETFGEGGYFMCHNGPFWNGYFRRRTLPLAAVHEGICQDNIGVPPFTSAGGCFCSHCEEAFRMHLIALYGEHRLREFGVEDPGAFSFRDHALRHGLVGERALEDGLAREYIRFQYGTHRDRWLEHAVAFKQEADRAGRPLSVSGNQILTRHPYPLVLSAINDVIEVERLSSHPDYVPENDSWAYRLCRASGRGERPVWFRGSSRMGPEGDLMDSWVGQEALYGEAAANGCIRTIHMADDHWPRLEVTRAFTRIPEMRSMTAAWALLLHVYRSLFVDRCSLARVGLVYSFPTMMWTEFHALDLENPVPYETFVATSRALDAAHVPHDVVLFGYPGLLDDRWSLDRLRGYDALVVPVGSCVSDAQLRALEEFSREGGALLIEDGFARFNENREPREDATAMSVRGSAQPSGAPDAAAAALAREHALRTDAPPTMLFNPWASAAGDVVALHVVNYDLRMDANTVNVPGVVTVDVPLPPRRRTPYASARLLTIDGLHELPRPVYDFEAGAATVRFALDRSYGIVVLADDEKQAEREREIDERRENVRRAIRAARPRTLERP